jgi:Bifunctional DNA primase/polymerase, N-terminal
VSGPDWAQRPRMDAALRYARAGWPVFPVQGPRGRCAGSDGCGCKRPLTEHGFKDASTDPLEIAGWWRQWPAANVAVATGAPGPDVVDVDHHGERGNGFAAFNRIKREGLVTDPQAVVSTPSGGMHLYFAADPERPQGSGSLPKQHIDFRGAGGYVIAPPSHVHGRPYEVVSHQAQAATVDFAAIRRELEPQPAPRQRRQPQRDAERGFDHLPGWVAGLQPGNRNGGLHWAASRAAEAGALDADMSERLVDAALKAGIRGGEREARNTVASARQGAARPLGRQPDEQREAG